MRLFIVVNTGAEDGCDDVATVADEDKRREAPEAETRQCGHMSFRVHVNTVNITKDLNELFNPLTVGVVSRATESPAIDGFM